MYQTCFTFGNALEEEEAAFVAAIADGVKEATPNNNEAATVNERAMRDPLGVAWEIE